jgi:hypothetical protein
VRLDDQTPALIRLLAAPGAAASRNLVAPHYGKTKHGKFMTEDEAVKAGYRAAKEGAAKKK